MAGVVVVAVEVVGVGLWRHLAGTMSVAAAHQRTDI
jgi:hypothetical protein